MPKLLDSKSASRAGAVYDDGKRVSPFVPKKPIDLDIAHREANIDALKKIAQAIETMAQSATTNNNAPMLQHLAEMASEHQKVMQEMSRERPRRSYVFEHERDGQGKIIRTTVKEN